MTPAQLAKSGTEHGEQRALFAYIGMAHKHGFEAADMWSLTGHYPTIHSADPVLPDLEWFHAVHNQGHGDAIRGARAKAEGVKKGVADTFLPVPTANYPGLYIEMKKRSELPKTGRGKGGMSDDQIRFANYVKSKGYAFRTCYGWEHAATTIRSYLEGGAIYE